MFFVYKKFNINQLSNFSKIYFLLLFNITYDFDIYVSF